MNAVQTEEVGLESQVTITPDLVEKTTMPMAKETRPTQLRGKWWMASGIFLFVLSLYVLTSPGRIDIIDGQARFDVAYNWLVTGHPILRDKWIGGYMGVLGRGGLRYSYYGAPGSVFAMPLVWMGLHTTAPAIQPSQFLFSLTSAIFGAGTATLLFLFYLEFGVAWGKALLWTMVSSFATLVWPLSTSTFDNAQHAFFALAAVYFGFLSVRRGSAAYAIAGGLMAGVLVLYQQYFLLIVPALALSTLKWQPENSPEPSLVPARSFLSRAALTVKEAVHDGRALIGAARNGPGEARTSCLRYALFLAGVSVGVALSLAYNHLRFGSWMENGTIRSITAHAYPLFGNPLAGFLTLLISPGKSIFLYSPPLVLCFMGLRCLKRRHREIALAVGLASCLLVMFLSCICFVGGDWCWGPRYLTVLLPLWALALPFLELDRTKRKLGAALIGMGLLVQVMALSVENQRFFLENGFNDYFWAEDAWVYFKHSALLSRVGEIASLSEGVPAKAKYFNSVPIPEWSTYAILGPPRGVRQTAELWMCNFKIFFVPRPWPLWMWYLPSPQRPIPMGPWLWSLVSLAALGGGFIYFGLQERSAR